MKIHKKKSIFNVVSLAISLFFVVRLIFTFQPPVEYEHAWRQATGLMYARNFVETDPNFFHPRVDDNAGGTGIVILEAPIMYYGMYLMSIPSGYQEWFGRLINLIISSIGTWFFFLLIRRFFSEKTALYATLLLLTSGWLIFSRKTMQDTFALSLMIIGLEFAFRYFEQKRKKDLIFYAIFAALGILSKIPAGMYLIFPLIYLWIFKPSRKSIISWLSVTAVPILLAVSWYFIYMPYGSRKYGYGHNLGVGIEDGLYTLLSRWNKVFELFFFQSHHSFVFIFLFLFAWIWFIREKKWKLLIFLGCFNFIFLGYMIRSGTYFIQHNYYMLPYEPVAALVVGIYLNKIKKQKWAVVLLVLCMSEGIAWQARDFTNSPREEYKLELISIAERFSSFDDRVVLINNGSPVGFYLTHRKGWMFSGNNIPSEEQILELYDKNVRLVIVNRHYHEIEYNFPEIFSNDDFYVYRLSKP